MTLFMTEIRVADPDRVSSWYAGVLGLRVVLRDGPKGFVLLEAPGGGRLALKRGGDDSRGPMRTHLVFQVDNLDLVSDRLRGEGVSIEEPVENPEEGYRGLRLSDPVGTPITLFAWSAC